VVHLVHQVLQERVELQGVVVHQVHQVLQEQVV
jgi:hypothetical protein